MTTRTEIFNAIEEERTHQERKYGVDKEQSLVGFILVLEQQLQQAKDGWMNSVQSGRRSPLHEIVQVAAVAFACLEKYGLEGCPSASDDNQPRIQPVGKKHDFQDYTECCIYCGMNAYSDKIPEFCSRR